MSKLSEFNHIQPWRDGLFIAYNALSGAVALMTAENYATYRRVAEKLAAGGAPSFTPEEQELAAQMEFGHFTRRDDYDERSALRFSHNCSRYDRTMLGLTIAPTLACNMACQYCYEANKSGRMPSEVIENIIRMVEKRATMLSALDVCWYGGEPLLVFDIIEDLTESFMDLAKEHKFRYSASMISNGYLLTADMVERLVQAKVGMVQVTIDGPSRFHNAKRPLKNGQPSFETIVNNLAQAAGKIGLGIRVNIDKSFTGAMIAELLDELTAAGLKDRVGVYFGQIEPSVQACADISETCYETSEFSETEIEYYRILLDKGFRVERIPAPIATYCMAQSISSFMIDPEGYLYKCYNHVGDKALAMGNVKDEVDYQNKNFLRLFSPDPFDDPTCRGCNLLPVCMGGCPSRRVDRAKVGEQACESWKHNLQPMLEIIARSRQRQMQQQATPTAAKE